MKPSDIYISFFVFLALFTGFTGFQTSLYDNHNVESQTTVSVDQEFEQAQRNLGVGEFQNNSESLYYKIANPKERTGIGVVDQAVAGILVVPRFIDVMLSPINILSSFIDGMQAQYSWIPGFIFIAVEGSLYILLGFAVLSVYLGIKS